MNAKVQTVARQLYTFPANQQVFQVLFHNYVSVKEQISITHSLWHERIVTVPQKPDVFTTVALDGGIFEVSWNQYPSSDITNYTIFWCEKNESRPNECTVSTYKIHQKLKSIQLPRGSRINCPVLLTMLLSSLYNLGSLDTVPGSM